MDNPEEKTPKKRAYPAIYEKIVPIFLGLIGVAIIILLVISFAVVAGIFPGS
jgi:hypothetical protein